MSLFQYALRHPSFQISAAKGRKKRKGESILAGQLQEKHVNELYLEIGHKMRSVMDTEGIEKSLPEEEPDGFPRRFVDFRISEDAIPQISHRLGELNDRVIELLITLCSIRI